jgi:hypothetical protein
MNPLHAETWARFYYECGLNPLPSRTDRKGPLVDDYARYRDVEPIPREWLGRNWWRNIQIPCGVPWRLLVVDVDGPRALQQWCRWHLLGREWPETWTVRTKGGRHYYYRIPEGVATCPTRKIWLETKDHRVVKHSEIQILADKALVIAPPSRHVDPPHPVYAFLSGRAPCDGPMATAPMWLVNCKEFKVLGRPKRVPFRRRAAVTMNQREWESIEAIPEAMKMAMAQSWGLRFASLHPNSKGWVSCHAIDREDRNPSASLHLPSGVFWQSGQRAMSFPGLAVALGAARDMVEAYALCGILHAEASK